MTSKSISLIVPAYKEENTIVEQIKELNSVLLKITSNFEIIIVADGFNDKTFEKAKKIKLPRLRVYGYEKNMGKGYAVKYGVEKAKGEIVGFIDSGMDLDPSEIPQMAEKINSNGIDIVIGSKLHHDSKVVSPFFRKILSWGYQTIIRMLFSFKVKDTQVGLKLFRRNVAKEIFSRVSVKGFAFDIEVFVLALKLGYDKIYEAPIKLRHKQNSLNFLNFLKTIIWMLWDTFVIFYRLKALNYYNKQAVGAKSQLHPRKL
jgi:glycosyltransferase involved in cell wall biosynthesis